MVTDNGLRIAVFVRVVGGASFFWSDNEAPPLLGNRAVWQEDDKRGGTPGNRSHNANILVHISPPKISPVTADSASGPADNGFPQSFHQSL